MFCEEFDDCWQTEDSWGVLTTELFNKVGTDINGDDNWLLFELLIFQLNHCLSQGAVSCLTWLFYVPLLWRLPISFGHGMMNSIWVCDRVVWLLFSLLMAIRRWDPTFWRDNYSNVWVSVPGIKLITSVLPQYNPNLALKYDLSEKGHCFMVHISYYETKIIKNHNISIWEPLYAAHFDMFQFIQKIIFDYNTYTKNWVPFNG